MVGQKVDGLIDLLKRRDKLKKRHGGVVQLPNKPTAPWKEGRRYYESGHEREGKKKNT